MTLAPSQRWLPAMREGASPGREPAQPSQVTAASLQKKPSDTALEKALHSLPDSVPRQRLFRDVSQRGCSGPVRPPSATAGKLKRGICPLAQACVCARVRSGTRVRPVSAGVRARPAGRRGVRLC